MITSQPCFDSCKDYQPKNKANAIAREQQSKARGTPELQYLIVWHAFSAGCYAVELS
jgi:hypothetical protein